ncbi:hypothetical protein FQA47_020148 [Oryzias melastigma]|uniref:Uncharacterized protein n=1 Tax=Oryzias melastigma TaxID=30732 RepID=A0A834FST1_ORYME|nr:hypothetical protein FQA47_020148 [Oryzias melastigma]
MVYDPNPEKILDQGWGGQSFMSDSAGLSQKVLKLQALKVRSNTKVLGGSVLPEGPILPMDTKHQNSLCCLTRRKTVFGWRRSLVCVDQPSSSSAVVPFSRTLTGDCSWFLVLFILLNLDGRSPLVATW